MTGLVLETGITMRKFSLKNSERMGKSENYSLPSDLNIPSTSRAMKKRIRTITIQRYFFLFCSSCWVPSRKLFFVKISFHTFRNLFH